MRASRFIQFCSILAAAFGLAAIPAQNAVAQDYPSRPITIVAPWAPGPAQDVAWRAITTEASKLLGQPIVFENRPGARSRLGVNAMKRAPADGYLLNIVFDNLLIAQPIADPDFKMEVGRDYAPVVFGFQFPMILAGNAGLPFRDLKGLIAHAKANPGKVNVAITHAASTHIMTERFRQAAGIEVAQIPYKGAGSDQFSDLSAGRVDLTFTSTTVKPFIDSGKVVGIATTGAQRWSAFPQVPTLTEAGIPVVGGVWHGIIAPAGTPAPVIAKLNNAFNAVLRMPEIRKKLDDYGLAAGSHTTPEAFAAFIRSELEVWKPVIQKAGIKLE